MKLLSVTIQVKAIEQYFPVYKAVLTFESANKILKCDHLDESY